MQKVNFTWELIIADDFSTDGTREIILEYKKKYPNFIKLILQERNVGAAKNWMDLITSPKAKYIAYFEGDDYWTNPYKLQKQVDIMESDPAISFCFHSVKLLIENEDSIKERIIKRSYNSRTFSMREMILGGGSLCPSQSVMFKKEAILDLPDWYIDAPAGDYFFFVWVATKGKVYYLKDTMAVYRANSIGSWSSNIMLKGAFRKRLEHNKKMIEFVKKMDQSTNYKFNKWFKIFMKEIIKAILRDEYDTEFKNKELKSYLTRLSYLERLHLYASLKIPLWEKITRNLKEIINYYFHFNRIL